MPSDSTPLVPGVLLTVNPGVRAQHSRIDWLLAAVRAVMFNLDDAEDGVGVDEGTALLVCDADEDTALVRPVSAMKAQMMEESLAIFVVLSMSEAVPRGDQLICGKGWLSTTTTAV
jgi:hypothetical protein